MWDNVACIFVLNHLVLYFVVWQDDIVAVPRSTRTETRPRLVEQQTVVNDGNVKKARSYEGYIQRKFSPSIMTEVLLNLSEAQKKWVKSTGFESLLHFSMSTYPHRLGYNVVDAFCSTTCSIKLSSGEVKITDTLVHNIIGFPKGELAIDLNQGRIGRTTWDQQYPSNQITPNMIKEKIKESQLADNIFKMNFLILVYNFFIEGNLNNNVTRDLLSFRGNIDECGRYNWCKLLIDKLKTTHAYWSQVKKRNFTGPLAFLIVSVLCKCKFNCSVLLLCFCGIVVYGLKFFWFLQYCYVSCVRGNETTLASPIFPLYRGWSDAMLQEREKTERTSGSFGVGEVLMPADETEVIVLSVSSLFRPTIS